MSRTFIQTDDLQDGDITAPKLAVNSVTNSAITDSAVTNSKLASLSVSQVKIANQAVGTTQIELNAITSALIAPSAVISTSIAPNAVIDTALSSSAKQAVLTYKKVTGYVQVNETQIVQNMTNVDVTTIIGVTTIPAYSGGVTEGILVDEPKNYSPIRNSFTGLPAVTNSLEIYGRLSVTNPGTTEWSMTFYTQPVGGPEVITPIPPGLTIIDWQYLQRFNLNVVDESWAADDKFFNGTVDLTEVLNINQLSKDIYTTPVLTNLGNAHLAEPLETQIRDIVTGLTTITPTLAPRSVPGLAIQINAITQLHMSSGSVGLTQIEDQSIVTVALRDLNVTTDKLANLSVTTDKIADFNVITSKIEDDAVIQAKIASAAVGLTQLENQAVTNTKIRDGAVSQSKISAGAVGITQIEAQAVDTPELRDGAVTMPKIGAEAVGVTQIELQAIVSNLLRDFAVTNQKLAANSVTTDKIADGTVIAVDIAPGAVDTLELSNSAVTNPKLAVNAVTSTNISDTAVTQSKIAAGAVGLTQIEPQSIVTTLIRDLNVTQPKIGNQAVGLTQIELQAVDTAQLRDLAVTAAKIANGTITEAKLSANAVGTTELQNSSVTNAKILDATITSGKIASGQVVKSLGAYGQSTLTDNVKLEGSSAIVVTTDGLSNAVRIEVMSLNLSQLSDVSIISPVVNDVLQWNGADWISGTPVNTSAGAGVVYFLDDAPSSDGNSSLTFAPNTNAEHSDNVVVNNSTGFMDGYLSAALGRTQIDGGIWEFDIYRYVDTTAGVSTIVAQVLKRFVGTGTLSISAGPGTSRTATVTGGTPFLAGDANADMTLAGYLETPTQTFQITGWTSSSVVTIATPNGYVSESGVAYSVHRYLFQAETGEINDTTVTLENVITAQPAYTGLSLTDELSVRYYGRTTNTSNTTVSQTHDGTLHYSHIHTPLVTRHNDLAGLQGGAGDERYHLTATQSSYLSTISSNVQDQLNAKASTTLNNLTNVAFNQDLTPDTGNTRSIGSPSKPVQDVNLKGSLNLQQSGVGTSAVSVKAPASVTPYPITVPAVQGLSDTFPQNDGSGNLAWNLVNTNGIQNQAVTQPKIANAAVGTTQIELQAIVESLLRDYAVTNIKLAPNSVTTDKIADGTVIAVDIAPGAVDTLELSNSAVTNPKLAVNAVTSTNISDSAVTNSKIAAGAVGLTQIESQAIITGLIRDGAITNPKVAANAIDTLQLSDSSVTNPKLSVNAVTSTNISDSAVTQTKISVGAVGLTQLENQSVTTAAIRNLNVTQGKIANGAVGLTQIESQAIITTLIRDQAVTQPKIADGAVGLTQLEPSVFASVHHHYTNVSPVSAPDGITTFFAFTVPGTPVSGQESVFINGVLRYSGVGNDYTAAYLTNQLSVTFTFAPSGSSRIVASGIY